LIVEVHATMNATLLKFGFPSTRLREFEHWCILRRPAQVTLGALVLASKHDATSLGTLPLAAYAELQSCTSTIETALKRFRPYDKINYLALMMVDPHVHFHVIPRYANEQHFEGVTFPDASWPGIPDLKTSPILDETTRKKLHTCLLDAFAFVV
jgi:diadenosine tetraphosphate (Ap4A) HIT family hydrolase